MTNATTITTAAIIAAIIDRLADTSAGNGQSTKGLTSYVRAHLAASVNGTLGTVPAYRVRYALDKLVADGTVAREKEGNTVYWYLTEAAQQANLDHAAEQLAEAMGVDSVPQPGAPEGLACVVEAGPLTTPSDLTAEQVLAASRKLYSGETTACRRVVANGTALRLVGGALRKATELLANTSSYDLTVASQEVRINASSTVVSGAALFVLAAELAS